MSEQKWLQQVGVNLENNTPLYYVYENSAVPVPHGWICVGYQEGLPVWSPLESVVHANGGYNVFPSIPLVPVVNYSEPFHLSAPLGGFPGYPSLPQADEKISIFTLFHESLMRLGYKESRLTLDKLDGKQKNAKELDTILDECVKFLMQKNEELSKKGETLQYTITFYLSEKETSKHWFLPNLRKKLLEKLAQNKAKFTHIEVVLDDPIGDRYEKVKALQFSSTVNSQTKNALTEWKNRLTTLLNGAGRDQEKLKVVEAYVEETEKVIRAVDNALALNKQDETPEANVAQVELFSALESFQEKVLKLSDNEKALRDASLFLGAVLGIGVALAMAIALSFPPLFVLAVFPLLFLGRTIAQYVVDNAIGADAVDPEKKDFISNKLTEFGIFGNTLKHKARTFLDAIKENGLESSGAKTVELEAPTAPVDQAVQPPVLVPFYMGAKQ